MEHRTHEWLNQADYDLDTAEYMFHGGRYFYSVFMCHLAVEKALKALYCDRLKQVPPKVHNLVYLLKEIGIRPPEDIGKFMVRLNEANIATRYPNRLEEIQKAYTEAVSKDIISRTRESLQWIKSQL